MSVRGRARVTRCERLGRTGGCRRQLECVCGCVGAGAAGDSGGWRPGGGRLECVCGCAVRAQQAAPGVLRLSTPKLFNNVCCIVSVYGFGRDAARRGSRQRLPRPVRACRPARRVRALLLKVLCALAAAAATSDTTRASPSQQHRAATSERKASRTVDGDRSRRLYRAPFPTPVPPQRSKKKVALISPTSLCFCLAPSLGVYT